MANFFKAISLWQPWASLWLSERKLHETRHWPLRYRGVILVHAAKRFEKRVDDDLKEILDDEFGGHWAMDLPTGAIIGAVQIIACWSTNKYDPRHDDDLACGDWTEGRYAWERANKVIKFPVPIPYRGRQGLFEISGDVADHAEQLISAAL